MMTGIVTAESEATLALTVRSASGHEHQFTAVIDTGFNGFLTLSNAEVAALGLAYYRRTVATLADGSSIALAIYKATVVWHGRDRSAYVLAADAGAEE